MHPDEASVRVRWHAEEGVFHADVRGLPGRRTLRAATLDAVLDAARQVIAAARRRQQRRAAARPPVGDLRTTARPTVRSTARGSARQEGRGAPLPPAAVDASASRSTAASRPLRLL